MITAPYQPRQFVPDAIDLTDTAQLAPLFDRLQEQLAAAVTPQDLEAWLDCHGELCAAMGQGSSIAYIRMTWKPQLRRRGREVNRARRWRLWGASIPRQICSRSCPVSNKYSLPPTMHLPRPGKRLG